MDIWCCDVNLLISGGNFPWKYKWMNSCAWVNPDFLHPISLLSFSPACLDFLPSINALYQPTNQTFCRHFPESVWHLSGNNEVEGTCFLLVPLLPADNTSGTCWGFLEVGEELVWWEAADSCWTLSPSVTPVFLLLDEWWLPGQRSLSHSEDKRWKTVGTFQPSQPLLHSKTMNFSVGDRDSSQGRPQRSQRNYQRCLTVQEMTFIWKVVLTWNYWPRK